MPTRVDFQPKFGVNLACKTSSAAAGRPAGQRCHNPGRCRGDLGWGPCDDGQHGQSCPGLNCWREPSHCQAPGCWRRRQIDPVCRLPMTQRDDLEPIGGLGIAAANCGSVKSWHLGQICVGANTLAMKEIEKHRKAMIGLYLGACIGAGAFTLLPSRYLGGIVWSYFGLIG